MVLTVFLTGWGSLTCSASAGTPHTSFTQHTECISRATPCNIHAVIHISSFEVFSSNCSLRSACHEPAMQSVLRFGGLQSQGGKGPDLLDLGCQTACLQVNCGGCLRATHHDNRAWRYAQQSRYTAYTSGTRSTSEAYLDSMSWRCV